MAIQLFQPLLSPSEPSNRGKKIYPLVVTITFGILGTLAHFMHFSGLSGLGDSYLLELSRSLHLNPVKAKIMEKPKNYHFSSYRSLKEIYQMSSADPKFP